jgi:DNA-directed RNA polymerases I, II, and III subunit RPABC2
MVEKEIVSDKVEIGVPYLTKYERARIVGARALQLSYGAPNLLSFESETLTPIEMARRELDLRVLPLGIQRRLPSGKFQIIPIQMLKDSLYIEQVDADEDIQDFMDYIQTKN